MSSSPSSWPSRECHEANGEDPLRWKNGDLATISAYRVYPSRGNPVDIEIPSDSASAWYEQGKKVRLCDEGPAEPVLGRLPHL